jgi:hypothetical protein
MDTFGAPGAAIPELVTAAPSADQNDYAPGLSANPARLSILVLSPTNSIKITGLSTTGWSAGKEVIVRNGLSITGANGRMILLERNSASSIAANRMQYQKANSDFSPIILLPGDEARFRFDGTDLKFAGQLPGMRVDGFVTRYGAAVATLVNGAGAGVTQDNAETDSNGFIVIYYDLATGTTTTGAATGGNHVNQQPVYFGAGCVLGLFRVNVPALSTVAEEFKAIVGFNDAIAAGSVTDAIGWKYDRLSSTAWRASSISNTTETVNTTGLTVTAGRYDLLGVFVNGDASRVDHFYSSDGGETWTIFGTPITTNIPSGAARATGCGASILKSAGTTTRSFRCSFNLLRWIR